jgi:hypothetical protein
MSGYITRENDHLAGFKASWSGLSEAARAAGFCRGHAYPFCVPADCAEENLFEGVRAGVLAYFDCHRIKWHMGQDRRPSNHLRSSQICCVNFLEPFATRPEALAALLRPLYGDITVLPIEAGRYVAYEWIGAKNYLHEVTPPNGVRQRGALYTSADAAVLFRRCHGQRQAVLIEWKYTESYGNQWLGIAPSGTDRRDIYRHLWERADCPLDRERIGCYDALFYEPFYQLMRQQFLAHEMECAHELGADIVSTLHIAPGANKAVERVTSPALRALGETASGVWASIVRPSDRFCGATTEQLFGGYQPDPAWMLSDWQVYLRARYGGILDA